METRWGKRLGRYEIAAEAGRGAMGVVYKARDPKIDRFVAVKAISLIGQNPDEEREYRERFFHEAQAAGRLLHPGIVTIFDVGEEPESRAPYIVMEFITGQSLNALLSGETKKLPLDTALRLAEELAEALDYAHAQGVVHRDIKPANILITEDGHAKIADFGIAKLNLAHLTIPGHAIGTPAYMSPEQLDGQAVDGRSDLFSLGVVLYNMITGHKPFQGNTAASVCFKVTNRDPLPATSFDVGLPPELDAVIARALAKDPAQRYQRGIEFALDVRELRQRSTAQSTTTTSVSVAAEANGVRALFNSGSVVRKPAAGELDRGDPGKKDHKPLVRLRNSFRGTASLLQGIPAHRYLVLGTLVVVFGLVALLFGIPLYLPSKASTRLGETPDKNHLGPSATRISDLAPAAAVPATEAHANPLAASGAKGADPTIGNNAISNPSSVQGHTAKHSSTTAGLSHLKIQVRHHFADAKLSLWIDNKLVYSRSLHGESKQHLVLFRGVQGYVTAEVQVAAGVHSLRVHAQSNEDSFDESKTTATNFANGEEKTLHIDFEKHNREMQLDLH